MITCSKLRLLTLGATLILGGIPAFAQDYTYSPHERYLDELNSPYEADGLELGREAPFLSSGDLGARGLGASQGGSFEIEGPPIGSSLPVIRP